MSIVLACGGTGGHIFPAISVAEEIARRDPSQRILYICGRRDIEDAIFRVVDRGDVVAIRSAPLRGAVSLIDPRFIAANLMGFFSSLALFIRRRPRVVVGFGGHTSFPAVMAAKCLGIPTMLHEQNAMPGRANVMLAGWVDRVALSYPESRGSFSPRLKAVVTGNPIRSTIERAQRAPSLEFFGFDPARRTLLVLGGSQGAESINRFFLEALPLLAASLRARLQVLHLCGKMAPAAVEAALKDNGVPGRAYAFFERMDLAYGAADAALGRAGATFLAELESRGIPSILIPYPFAGGHQMANARAFARTSASVVMEQSTVTPERLAREIEKLFASTASAGHKPEPGLARRRLADAIGEAMR